MEYLQLRMHSHILSLSKPTEPPKAHDKQRVRKTKLEKYAQHSCSKFPCVLSILFFPSSTSIKNWWSQAYWHTPIIPVTKEAEAGRPASAT